MAGKGVGEAGEGHIFPRIERVEERLELRLIRMVAHVAAIEHLHGKLGPRCFVQPAELHGVELVIEDAALAADEVSVEVIGLEAVHDGCAFAHRAAFEPDERGRRRGVFVGGENGVAALRGVAGDFFHLGIHAEEEGVERVATGGKERAAAEFLVRVPAVLAIPRADAVVVINFTVVEFADEPFLDDGFGAGEIAPWYSAATV